MRFYASVWGPAAWRQNIQSCFDLCRAVLWSRRFWTSRSSRVCGLSRWKMRRSAEPFSCLDPGLFLWLESSSSPSGSVPLLETGVAHWFCFICLGFVVTHGNTVKALSGAVSRRGKSLGRAAVNPIVFGPMWGEGDWRLGACVCLCLRITKFSLLDSILLQRLLCLVPNISTSQAALCVFYMSE